MPSETVKVMVRVRPMNQKEVNERSKSCVQVEQQTQSIQLIKGGDADTSKVFSYDEVFHLNELQQNIYEKSAFNLVESCFEGYNGTIFAYGQTGCGKTFTMMGDPGSDQYRGIIPRTFSHIMNVIETQDNKKFLVRVSYIEIYNEEIHDLLGKDVKARYELKEHPEKGLFIKDLNMIIVKSVNEMEKYMVAGNQNRTTGETLMNKDSSRSHSIFTIYIECSVEDEKGNQRFTAGKLNLVDLAGSERQSKTQATGDRLKEANKINLSLSALGNVISALVDGRSQHIPYRDSKLTRLLQDSLGGNTKTIMIANISPADYNYDETLGTLRYASRAKNIKNKPIINEDPKDALLKEYADEIKRLKQLLENQGLTEGKIQQLNLNGKQDGSAAGAAGIIAALAGSGVHQIGRLKSHNTKDFEELQMKHEQMYADKNKMEQELKERDKLFQKEKEEREKMESMLKELQGKQIQGGKGDVQKKKNYNNLKKKLQEERQKREELFKAQQEKEQNFERIEKNFQNLQDENEAQKKTILRLLKEKKQAEMEIKDLENEHYQQIEELNDTIRIYDKDQKLYESILNILLTKPEITMIRTQAEWQDDKNTYKVPPFFFKEKQLKFPKLPFHQAIDFVEKEKEKREIDFGQDRRRSSLFKGQNSIILDRKDSKLMKNGSTIQLNQQSSQEFKESRDNRNRKQIQQQGHHDSKSTQQQDRFQMYKEMPFMPAHKITAISQQSIMNMNTMNRQPSNEQIQEIIKKNVNVILDPLKHYAQMNIQRQNSKKQLARGQAIENGSVEKNKQLQQLPKLNHNAKLPALQGIEASPQPQQQKRNSKTNLAPLQNNQPSKIDVSIKATLHFNSNQNDESDDNISEINEENSYQ